LNIKSDASALRISVIGEGSSGLQLECEGVSEEDSSRHLSPLFSQPNERVSVSNRAQTCMFGLVMASPPHKWALWIRLVEGRRL